jgi:integrase
MPRTGKRRTIAKGIYRDGNDGGYEVRVTVGGEVYSARLPKDSTLEELKRARARLESRGRTDTPKAERGTLAADAIRYLKLIQHLRSWKDREDHLDAWIARVGDTYRHRITAADVLSARVAWLKQGKAPKTINHRTDTLRHLYRTLDGKKAETPCDDIEPLPVPKTPIHRVSEALLLAVDRNLQERERDPSKQFDGAKTRARFRVFVSTGKRPCEIMRAKPSDVDLRLRVWVPRDAKGGFCPGVYLNDDQLEAWKLFIKAEAWGPYNHGNFGRVIRKAGWPKDVRPYQARHNTWMAASEAGIDLADIATGAGHTDSRMTRRMYVPVLNSRLQRLGEALEGRFQGWPVVPKRGTAKSSNQNKGKRA